MFELLFLLLPIAAVYGYYMGRLSIRQTKNERKNKSDSAYLKGFDYLLNHKKDKAVDKFIAYINSKDEKTFDSSLALANLFRQRGEVDRAISVHEQMIADSTLSEQEVQLAKLELAKDFYKAGLLDRCENILSELVDIPLQRAEASRLLIKVYEKELDFAKAIEIANRFSDVLTEKDLSTISQYYCELARSSSLKGDRKSAVSYLKKAISVYDKSVRARLDLADLYISDGQLDDAYQLIKSVSVLRPDFGLLCLDKIKKSFPNTLDPKYRYSLEDLVHRTGSTEAQVELVKTVEQTSGTDDAIALIDSYLKLNTNLKLFSEFLELKSHKNSSNADSLIAIRELIDDRLTKSNKYVCPNCGFESQTLFWQCPSCRKWESLKPKIGIDGD
ncbi:MAG: tetratricopeptide repeat protein [Succinivibrio sp.]